MVEYVDFSLNRKRKNKCSFFKFSLILLLCFSVIFTSVFITCSGDDAGYCLLMGSVKNAFGAFTGSFDQTDNLFSGTSVEAGGTAVTKKGALNLSLIDRIPDVQTGKAGYVKELLSIYRDAQEGEIVTDKKIKPALTALLAQHINEVGTVEAGGDRLPAYYFSPSEWKKNTPGKCIYGYTSVYGAGNGQVNEEGGYGVLQHLNTPAGTKSKVNPVAGVSRGCSPGDCRFLPDMIQTSLTNFSDFARYVNLDYLSKDEQALIGALCNNRGGVGACSYMMGCVDYGPGSGSGNFLNMSSSKKYTKTDVKNTISVTVKLFDDYLNDQPADLKVNDVLWIAGNSNVQRISSVIIAQHSKNWYVDSVTYNYMVNVKWSDTSRTWDILYPSEKSLSGQEKKKRLQDMCKNSIHESVCDATGDNVTASDCTSAYGGDSYSRNYRSSYGSLWHISNNRCKSGLYKSYSNNSVPYYVSSFDFVAAGYLFVASGFIGRFYYAYLLKMAGVNSVDPTNPATYIYQTTTYVQPGKQSVFAGQLDSVYDGCHIKLEDLTSDRIAVLNTAAKIAYSGNFVYAYGGFIWQSKSSRFGTDCAHFCCLVYYYSGLGGHYTNTAGLNNGNADWEYISDFSEAKPGDVVVTRGPGGGHAEIYLSGKDPANL